MCIHTYIYRERDIYTHQHIYIYIERERYAYAYTYITKTIHCTSLVVQPLGYHRHIECYSCYSCYSHYISCYSRIHIMIHIYMCTYIYIYIYVCMYICTYTYHDYNSCYDVPHPLVLSFSLLPRFAEVEHTGLMCRRRAPGLALT